LSLPLFLVLLGLGSWQVDRLNWKEGLIAAREARIQMPLVELPGATSDPDSLEFRRARASGRFLHEHEMYLASRVHNGNVGYHVVTPLSLGKNRFLLVDRGWVPLERKAPISRPEGQLEGEVTVTGLIRKEGRQGFFTPDNAPDGNFWFYVDIPEMAAFAGLSESYPFYLEADATPNPGGLPIGGSAATELNNPHFSYAITWYMLAGILVAIYVLYHLRRA
jgi:surfeit locus 1 family protein